MKGRVFYIPNRALREPSADYCLGISISEEHTATIFRSEAHFTATDGQLYCWYPPIILYSSTVGTHQSYRTAVQSVPTNHTAQLYSRYPPIIQHRCTVGTHQSYCTAVHSVPTNRTAQLYSRYPPIIPHRCTVGTHQSYRTVVQSVPTNHTAQLYSRYQPIILHSIITVLETLRGNIAIVVIILLQAVVNLSTCKTQT